MTEAYAILTTGNDYYDQSQLFGLYASEEKAEAEAAVLRERLEDERAASYPGERLYAQVTVAAVPIRF